MEYDKWAWNSVQSNKQNIDSETIQNIGTLLDIYNWV